MLHRFAAVVFVSLLSLTASCSTAAQSGNPNEATEVDIRTQCVNLPPVALESCRRGGRSGAGEAGM
jgi:hypothetical protein